jgi:hypothetical protein
MNRRWGAEQVAAEHLAVRSRQDLLEGDIRRAQSIAETVDSRLAELMQGISALKERARIVHTPSSTARQALREQQRTLRALLAGKYHRWVKEQRERKHSSSSSSSDQLFEADPATSFVPAERASPGGRVPRRAVHSETAEELPRPHVTLQPPQLATPPAASQATSTSDRHASSTSVSALSPMQPPVSSASVVLADAFAIPTGAATGGRSDTAVARIDEDEDSIDEMDLAPQVHAASTSAPRASTLISSALGFDMGNAWGAPSGGLGRAPATRPSARPPPPTSSLVVDESEIDDF